MNKTLKTATLLLFFAICSGVFSQLLFLLWPGQFFWPTLLLLTALSLFALVIDLFRSKDASLIIKIFLPVTLILGTILFFTTSKIEALDQIIVATSWLLLFFWLKSLSRRSPTISRLIMLTVFYSLFLTNLAFFEFITSYQLIPWLAITLVIITNLFILFYLLYFQKINSRAQIFFIVLLTVLIAQSFIVISFVPLGNYSKSGILVLVFYLYWGLLEKIIQNQISFRQIVEYIGVGVFLFLIIMGSSSWSFLNIR